VTGSKKKKEKKKTPIAMKKGRRIEYKKKSSNKDKIGQGGWFMFEIIMLVEEKVDDLLGK